MRVCNSIFAKLFLAVAITVAFGLMSAAQTRIRGIVVDEDTGEPVAGAFVMAYLNRVLAQNTMTDENGRFELECRSMPDTVMVSMMGYKPVKVNPQAATMTIKLKAQKLMLRQATVSAPPIIEKVDTVIYEAGAFKDAGDRVLKDLLEKLPGIEVTATGGVRQNEKPINKFYIEGLDLLGGRYTIATNNLSGIGTFNHLKRLGEDSQFKVSVNVAGERYKETALDSEKVKYASGDSIQIEESSKLTDNEYFWTIGNEYEKNGDKFYFNDNLTFSGQGRKTNSNVQGHRFYYEEYALPSLKLSNTARWTVKLSGRKAITIVIDSKAVRSSHDAKYSYHGNESQNLS